MTDMQFKSILLMVRQIMLRSKNLEEALSAVDEVLTGKIEIPDTDEDKRKE